MLKSGTDEVREVQQIVKEIEDRMGSIPNCFRKPRRNSYTTSLEPSSPSSPSHHRSSPLPATPPTTVTSVALCPHLSFPNTRTLPQPTALAYDPEAPKMEPLRLAIGSSCSICTLRYVRRERRARKSTVSAYSLCTA